MSGRFYKFLVITISVYFVGWAFFSQAEINPGQKVTARYSQSQFLFESAIGDISGGIVPCGRSSGTAEQQRPCTTCDLFWLADNLINFVVFKLVPIIATLFILFAGFLMIFGGPRPNLMKMGKDMMTYSLYGVAIIYSGWMVTNFVLKSIAGDSNVSKNWYKIECVVAGPVAQPPPFAQKYSCANNQCVTDANGQYTESTCGGNCSATVAADKNLRGLAQAVLGSDIKLATAADCGGSFNAKQNIQDMASGKFAAVCSSTCNCLPGGPSGDIYLNPKILEGLLTLNSWMKQQSIAGGFTITSLMTGKHSANSAHYTGQAADIVPGSANRADWQRIRSFLNGYGGTAICEGSGGNDVASCSGVSHIHWTFRF